MSNEGCRGGTFCTLISPKDWSAVAKAPEFDLVADKIIFRLLNGRVWAGHNIQRFNCVRIKEAFAAIIDSLV